MKALKIFLGLVYVLLIILVLLGLIRCNDSTTPRNRTPIPVPVPVDTVPNRNEDVDTTTVADSAEVIRQAEETGQSGDLKITLLWDFPGDIDLHVVEPNGFEIYYDKMRDTATGGNLDVDNRDGGERSAENVYWPEPPKGEYKVSLVYYQSSRSNNVAGSGVCRVVVFQKGSEPKTYEVPMRMVGDKKSVTTVTVN